MVTEIHQKQGHISRFHGFNYRRYAKWGLPVLIYHLFSPWLDLLAVQGTLKSLLQNHSSKASIPLFSAFFTVQLLHQYMTIGKTIALTSWTFVGKVMSLLLNMLSRLVITFLPRSKRLLISWQESPSAVILEPPKIGVDEHVLISSYKSTKITTSCWTTKDKEEATVRW